MGAAGLRRRGAVIAHGPMSDITDIIDAFIASHGEDFEHKKAAGPGRLLDPCYAARGGLVLGAGISITP